MSGGATERPNSAILLGPVFLDDAPVAFTERGARERPSSSQSEKSAVRDNKIPYRRVVQPGATLTTTATCVPTRSLLEEFEQVFREHSEFIYRTAYRVTGNAEDAEDVLQTLFVRLLRRDAAPEFGKNPKAYLYRATMNIALNL